MEWAIAHGIETATFHILTPYPGTALHARMSRQRRITTADWDRYDTRHAVFTPAQMTVRQLEEGYRRAYHDFYRWSAIARGALAHDRVLAALRHAAYAAGWKKFEPCWDLVIRLKQAGRMLPVLETILSEFGHRPADRPPVLSQIHDTARTSPPSATCRQDASSAGGVTRTTKRDAAGRTASPVH